MNQSYDYDDDDSMMITSVSQSQNQSVIALDTKSHVTQIDLEKIYEFNDDDEFNLFEFSRNGFQLNRANKSQDELNFSSDDESMDESSNETQFNAVGNDDIQKTSYASLNDYVLYDIFKLLSLIELQQCRIVCKRWRFLIDTIQIKKISLTYFGSKHSWSSNENFENLQQYSDSVDISSLRSFSRILQKPQFRDLEHLSLVTEYATHTFESANQEIFILDASKFGKLKKLELFGSFIQLKDNQKCPTLTHLSIEHITVDPMVLFPNLIYLKTNVYNSNTANPNLEQLDYFSRLRYATLDKKHLHTLAPNLQVLSCNFLEAFDLIHRLEKPEDFLFNRLTKINVHFDTFQIFDSPFDHLVQVTAVLNIKLEFHVNIAKSNTKGKEVNLRDLILLPNYENNTLLKQSLKVDEQSLQNIDDKIYKYLFHTNSLELNADGMEIQFVKLLQTIPCITKLVINYQLQQSTFDRFKFICPYLSYLKIVSSNQAYKLGLNFIHGLDHLTSIELKNIDLLNCSTMQNKIKFSKFLHSIQIKNCRLLDYCGIIESMIAKARKNTGKFYEIHILPIQQVHIDKFNEHFLQNAPENFYSNLFRFQTRLS